MENEALEDKASFIHEQVEAGCVKLRYTPGQYQLADLLTKGFSRQRLEELNGLWRIVDVTLQATKISMAKMMVAMMMIQAARAETIAKEPIQLDGSVELYILVLLVGVCVVAMWEAMWWLWYNWSGDERRDRKVRRLRRRQLAVEQELTNQVTDLVRPAAPQVGCQTTTPERKSIGVQASPAFQYMRPPEVRIEVREVPVPHVGPYFLTDSGDCVHLYRECWGQRNSVNIRSRAMCRVCAEGQGRQVFPSGTA